MEWDISLFWHAFVCHLKMKASLSRYSVDSQNFVYILVGDATHYVHFHIQFEYIRIQTNTEARNGIKKNYIYWNKTKHMHECYGKLTYPPKCLLNVQMFIYNPISKSHTDTLAQNLRNQYISNTACMSACCAVYSTFPQRLFHRIFSFKRIVKLENCNITTYPGCFSLN